MKRHLLSTVALLPTVVGLHYPSVSITVTGTERVTVTSPRIVYGAYP